ncbi:copper/iron-regulated glutamine amidotransferase [Aspergillus sclerotioniger CBS 115572]|uniref:Copper/iron-regulated glutamine amidotransferase n=1 Tax=Aspergillus sclerotioniger CBS 115572 TaxID=1450535 RepID=A0A317XFS7_9EURO|nr:copper/iron-regulated glutamine amidotransferase [Aspergillus sclerotioniger CBS 115572]PWY95988.1 copper/iron-regulated glutamine amidotransferase [Aspergillus sclerotioniger CBS 115572]
MSNPRPEPLRIAVLINTPPDNDFWNDVTESYRTGFEVVAPNAQLDMYDPIFQHNFPDSQEYDLIILSGGKADASSSEPWVLGVLEFLRRTAQTSPKTKILGICWGHQAISRAFGGEVRAVPTGPIAGIESIKLTEAGREFFSCAPGITSYKLPEFHVREVARPGSDFIPLAENHEMFVNQDNTVLTFQSHPEVQPALAKKMLLEEDDVYNGNLSKLELEDQLKRLEQPTDGFEVLRRVVEWVKE